VPEREEGQGQDDPATEQRSSQGGTAEGVVRRRITEDTEAAGGTVRAGAEAPQYEVESDKSGRTAVHEPTALHRK
jgi:hypothetical protein